jgi:hypothetical protein
MKHIFLCFTFCLLSVFLYAQTIKTADSIPIKGKLPFRIYDSLKPSFKTDNGWVYQLPQDGMPALRPDTSLKYKMPVFSSKPKNFYHDPSIKKLNPLIIPEKQGVIIIQTPDGPKQIHIH